MEPPFFWKNLPWLLLLYAKHVPKKEINFDFFPGERPLETFGKRKAHPFFGFETNFLI
jgi:hypothetical protein